MNSERTGSRVQDPNPPFTLSDTPSRGRGDRVPPGIARLANRKFIIWRRQRALVGRMAMRPATDGAPRAGIRPARAESPQSGMKIGMTKDEMRTMGYRRPLARHHFLAHGRSGRRQPFHPPVLRAPVKRHGFSRALSRPSGYRLKTGGRARASAYCAHGGPAVPSDRLWEDRRFTHADSRRIT